MSRKLGDPHLESGAAPSSLPNSHVAFSELQQLPSLGVG